MSGTDNGDGDNPNMKKFELYIKVRPNSKEEEPFRGSITSLYFQSDLQM